ncbi:MAG: radical SAM protein, partial [Flavobacteriales bacterium]|nr:radical SAM protein [Flavobacteriales bacterium]
NRLKAVEELVKAGIPVNVNLAPVIYNLNSDEIFDIAREVGERGAYSLSYIMVRLNGQIGEIFENWVKNAVPERAEKVLHHIRDTHNGTLNESRFGSRMRGEGKYAEQVAATFKLARKKFIKAPQPAEMDYSSFLVNPKQLSLF